jgi:hypothetical protein
VRLSRGTAESKPCGLHSAEKGTAREKQSPRHGLTERGPHIRPSCIQADKASPQVFALYYIM